MAPDTPISKPGSSAVHAPPVTANVNQTVHVAKQDNLKPMEESKAAVLEQAPTLQQAIGQLNTAIERLYKINGFLDKEMENVADIKTDADLWEKPVKAASLDVEEMNVEIDKVGQLTDRLLSDRRQLAEHQGGILPATKNFLRTVCHALSPGTKVILAAASQGSSLVIAPSETTLMSQVPVLSPYGILFNTLSKLIEVTPPFQFFSLQLLEKDSERKKAFEGELEGVQSNLMILRQHVNVPKRFENVKEEVQIHGLGVLSAMLDLIGRQLIYVNIRGGKIGNNNSSTF